MQHNQGVQMVGVGRIELPTPAMSTQAMACNSAEIRHFASGGSPEKHGTWRELRRVSPEFHRTDLNPRWAVAQADVLAKGKTPILPEPEGFGGFRDDPNGKQGQGSLLDGVSIGKPLGHTPGPWGVHLRFPDRVVPASHIDRPVGGAADDGMDLRVFAQEIASLHDRHRSREEVAANAHLIAAAPELLEASAEWIAYLDAPLGEEADGATEDALLQKMRAAIFKARGEVGQ